MFKLQKFWGEKISKIVLTESRAKLFWDWRISHFPEQH